MKVLLDSNIYRQDLTLDGGKFRLLFSQASQGRFEIALPEVVARETTELYRREIDERLNALDKAGRRLRSLRIPIAERNPVDKETEAEEFRKYLESKVLSGGALLGLPDVSHDHLVDQAIHKRRPFSGKDAGYRDALIWQSAMALAANDETVVLVTDNRKDFAAADGETLHPDLVAELEAAGAKCDSVLLYRDLDDFLEAWVPKEEAALQPVKELLADPEELAMLEDKLATVLAQLELPNEGHAFLTGLDIYSEGAWVETLDKIESIEVESAYSLGEQDASVELEATVLATIVFLANKGDLYSAERMHDLGEENDPPFYIYDYDYNDSLAAAEAPVKLSLAVQATFRAGSGELDDIEITDIDPTPVGQIV